MKENHDVDLDELKNNYQELISSSQTLLLATCSIENNPSISYSPYVRDENSRYYIFVSELAVHTQHLLSNPKASILFIKPEAECNNLYARERIVLNCSTKEILPDNERYLLRLGDLQDKFGDVVGLLRSLSDFHLFELTPETGSYVLGFGKAFTLNLQDGSFSHFSR